MKTKLRIIYAVIFLTVLLIEICIALFIHDNFIRPYIGDVLVTVLICCFFRIFIPDKLKLLPLFVFIFSSLVELAQYIDIVKLLGLQDNAFFSTLIGRTFSVHDILCYAVGCALFSIGELTARRIHQKA